MKSYSPLLTLWKSISASLGVFFVVALPVIADSVIPSVIDYLYRSPQNATVYVAVAVGALAGLKNFLKNRNK